MVILGTSRRGWLAAALVVVLSVAAAWLHLRAPLRDPLAAFSTGLGERTAAQQHNIRVAAAALDGAVIEPGEEFSFNARVGPRTLDRGYRRAEALLEGELVTSVGGGICQVSSTVYNAALAAGLTVITRVPHAWTARSVPPGRDATVWYGKTDLVLRNDRPHPVSLRLRAAAGRLQAEVLGTAVPGEAVEARVEVLGQEPTPVVRRYEPSWPRGRRRVLDPGQPGCRVSLVRYFLRDGRVLRREVVSKDRYLPRPRLVAIGTG